MCTNTHVGSQSMIMLLNNTQGLKIIENTVIFFSQNCSEKSQTLREAQPYTDHQPQKISELYLSYLLSRKANNFAHIYEHRIYV